MKRFAAALLAAISLCLVTAPAHADKPDRTCYSVAELPGECLSYETFVLIGDLQHQNRQFAVLLDNAWTVALEAKESASKTNGLLFDMTAQRDAALASLARRDARIVVLRAKVQTLRADLRAVTQ